jgi:ATP-dependent Clp protease ATP-binding subunit ClpB
MAPIAKNVFIIFELERNRLNLDGVEQGDKHFPLPPFWTPDGGKFVDSFNPTTKTQAVLTSALQAASAAGNPEIRPAHLLLALLTQNDGIAAPLLEAVGVEPATIRTEAEHLVERLPQASGSSSQPQLSRESLAAITTAQQLATEMDDEYVSTEHLMVGLATGDSEVAKLLTGHGA